MHSGHRRSAEAKCEILENNVLDTIKRYNMLESGDKVVVGVSGGPDSMTLLNILYNLKEKLNITIYVAHINHMIRKEADSETEYVIKSCDKLGIKVFVKKTHVEDEAKRLRISTEEAGRNIRYKFFEEVAQKTGSNKIATAHNSNDNAETVLMNIIRGSSTSGLKGIEKVRDNKFVRPLIETSREEIEEYCKMKNLQPMYDKSNKENIYTRNKIRNLLIPYLQKEFNPNIIQGINRLSELATAEDEFLNKIAKKEYNRLLIKSYNTKENYANIEEQKKDYVADQNIDDENDKDKARAILDLKEFNKLDKVVKSRILLYAISNIYGSSSGIEKIHIDDIIKMCSNNVGNKYMTPKAGIKIYIKKGKIFFMV